MPEIYSFPNNQDEYTGAEHVMRWHHGRTSGVFGAANNAAVAAAGGGMNVTVSDGLGWLSNSEGNGIVWWNDSEASSGEKLTLAVDTADGALNRVDRVVVSWSTTNYVARPTIAILKGTVSSAAVAPALTNNSTMRQISLARISVPAGATTITASMITDERMDSAVCGIVTDTVSVDTSMVNAQVSELIEELRYSLEQVVSDGVPAHASTHRKGGSDELTPADIGAASLDAYGKVNAAQASSTIKAISDATYTLTAADAGKFLMTRNESAATQAYTINVPNDQNNASFPVGTEIEICRYYPGKVTLAAGSSVVLLATDDASVAYGNSKSISGRYGVVAIKKIMSDRWLVKGEIE